MIKLSVNLWIIRFEIIIGREWKNKSKPWEVYDPKETIVPLSQIKRLLNFERK